MSAERRPRLRVVDSHDAGVEHADPTTGPSPLVALREPDPALAAILSDVYRRVVVAELTLRAGAEHARSDGVARRLRAEGAALADPARALLALISSCAGPSDPPDMTRAERAARDAVERSAPGGDDTILDVVRRTLGRCQTTWSRCAARPLPTEANALLSALVERVTQCLQWLATV